MDSKKLGHLALFSVAATYAANYLLAKGLMPNLIQPSGFVFARITGALILFLPILLLSGVQKIKKEHWLRVALCGVFGVGINQLFFFNGLNLTSPLNSALIITSVPIIVLVISALFLKAGITSRKVAGVFIGAAGAMSLIYLGQSAAGSSGSSWKGDLFVLINATSYSIYLIIVKPLMVHYKPITVLFWAFAVGWVLVAPFGMSQFFEVDWSQYTGNNFFAFGFVVVMATFLVYLMNIFALKHLPSTTVSVYIYLQPTLVILFTFLFFYLGLNDFRADLTWAKAGCALLIFVGVYLVSFEGKKKKMVKRPS
ncbi:MAG: DMT family transporter [Flavobacteriales bacterium]